MHVTLKVSQSVARFRRFGAVVSGHLEQKYSALQMCLFGVTLFHAFHLKLVLKSNQRKKKLEKKRKEKNSPLGRWRRRINSELYLQTLIFENLSDRWNKMFWSTIQAFFFLWNCSIKFYLESPFRGWNEQYMISVELTFPSVIHVWLRNCAS